MNDSSMLTSIVSEEGQTTVPAEIRKALKAPPGTVLAWAVNGGAAEVVPLTSANQRKRGQCDYDACLKSLKESPAVPDHLLIIHRSKES
jgi:bifunctional DNA-binding transcriptional regulator/antitoxin component of YhaV-PrlF toxin-antitoxin module